MKLHKNLIDAVVKSLQLIFNEGKYADKVIEKVLQSDKRWGARDRAFIAENTYEMVRWWRLIRFIAGYNQVKEEELTYELGWHLFGVWLLLSGEQLPTWKEFEEIDKEQIKHLSTHALHIRKIKESIPDWLDELGERELGKDWDKEILALNHAAPVVIRANTLKTTRGRLAKQLAELDIETFPVAGADDALVLKKRTNLFTLPFFKEGLFEVQDASSQLVASFLQVKPGMRVIDACAGAGGKTLHLAALMQNKGRIISMDTEQWKLDELKRRGRRAGANIIETKIIESSKTIKRLHDSADRLLLDVPCSGLGVLRRNPDAKWKLDITFIEKVKKMQADILNAYSLLLKPGGLMVYATCSILPSEDEEQVKSFLHKHPQFEKLEERRVSATEGFDGFYMALMKRNS
jgi:16S rRNA (cytosine967-C5)-methyltransferase